MHYIYIPGLGDNYDRYRASGLRDWPKRRKDVTAELVPMHWSDRSETYEQKFARVEAAIAAVPADQPVTLVGESAGGSMALAVFHKHAARVSRCVTVCGKNRGAQTLGDFYRQRTPVFPESVERTDAIIPILSDDELQRICVVYSKRDKRIRAADSVIDGARTNVRGTPGHLFSIFWVIFRPKGKIW